MSFSDRCPFDKEEALVLTLLNYPDALNVAALKRITDPDTKKIIKAIKLCHTKKIKICRGMIFDMVLPALANGWRWFELIQPTGFYKLDEARTLEESLCMDIAEQFGGQSYYSFQGTPHPVRRPYIEIGQNRSPLSLRDTVLLIGEYEFQLQDPALVDKIKKQCRRPKGCNTPNLPRRQRLQDEISEKNRAMIRANPRLAAMVAKFNKRMKGK